MSISDNPILQSILNDDTVDMPIEAVPLSRKFARNRNWPEAIGEALRRGGQTFVREVTSPLTEIPEGIKMAAESQQFQPTEETTVLDRLRNLGYGLAGAGRAGLSVARVAGAPFTALGRTAVEIPLSKAETPGQPRPAAAELLAGVGEMAFGGAAGIKALSVYQKLKQAALLREASRAALAEKPLTYAGPDVIERRLRPGVPPLALPERGVGPAPDRVFSAGPPGSVHKVPRVVMDPAIRETETGRIIRGPQPQPPGRLNVPKAEQVGEPPVVGVGGPPVVEEAEESIGQLLRRNIRERKAAGKPVPAIKEAVEDIPEGMSMREWVKLNWKNESKKVLNAADADPADLPSMPSHVQNAVNAGKLSSEADAPSALRHAWQRFKIRMPLTMTEVARGDPAFTKLVELFKNGLNDAQFMGDEWAIKLHAIAKDHGDDVFKAAARAIDRKQVVTDPNTLQAMNRIRAITDEWANAIGLDPDHPSYVVGYIPRLRQKVMLEKTRLIDVGDYMPEDVRRVIPSELHPYFSKSRVVDVPADVYDVDSMVSHARAVARGSVFGTPQHHGILKDMQPILNELSDRPESVQNFIGNYVNAVIGAPGSRSTDAVARWGNAIRQVEFLRTIGLNVTSPVYNSFQRVLIAAEVSPKAYAASLADEVAVLRGDAGLREILKKAKVSLESLGPKKLETETLTGSALEKGLTKATDISGKMFGFAERENRVNAFFAGYRQALMNGLSEDEAIKAGKAMIDKTQFMPSIADRPAWMRKEPYATIGQYKYFTTKMGEYMAHNFGDIFKRGASWEDKYNAAAKFAKFWAVSYAIGGPQSLPVIGGWLEKHDPLQWKGALPAMGAAVRDQVGVGLLPHDLRTLVWWIPGPALNHAKDLITALGYNPFGDETPRVAQRVAAATRSFPAGGVQLERVRRGLMVNEFGEEREPRNLAQAFGQEPIPRSSRLLKQDVNVPARMIGIMDPEQDVEYRSMDRLRTAAVTRNEAIAEAQQMWAEGDAVGARALLRETEEKLGIPPGSLKLSKHSLRSQQEAAKLTPSQRLKKSVGRSLQHFDEDTLP